MMATDDSTRHTTTYGMGLDGDCVPNTPENVPLSPETSPYRHREPVDLPGYFGVCRDGRPIGTLIIERQFAGFGRIRRSSGTKDPRLLKRMNDRLTAAFHSGDLDLIRRFYDRTLHPLDLLTETPGAPPRISPGGKSVSGRLLLYVIRATPSGNLKIGRTRDAETAIRHRVKGIQAGTWERLEVLAYWSVGHPTEAETHRRFKAHCIRGEWFFPHPQILAWIDENRRNATPR